MPASAGSSISSYFCHSVVAAPANAVGDVGIYTVGLSFDICPAKGERRNR